MRTIATRKRKDGTPVYLARVRVMRNGATHNETRTFTRKQMAQAWITKREAALADGLPQPTESHTLGDAIDRYVSESHRAIGRTKTQVLNAIRRAPIADMPCHTIKSNDIIEYLSSLHTKPQTRGNYLSHLSAVFAISRPAWGIQLDYQVIRDAIAVAKRIGLVGKSAQRERRPTLDELNRLMAHFAGVRARRPSTIPMTEIITFAIFSTRRQEEITRLLWSDLDGDRILVRDMKNPGDKVGNHQWCILTPQAQAIIERQPKTSDRIFPFNADAICAAFTRACKTLGIDDLHFHDLRGEGISRLFEMGWTIPLVASVSGHRSWTSLKIYARLRATGDKFEGWKHTPS